MQFKVTIKEAKAIWQVLEDLGLLPPLASKPPGIPINGNTLEVACNKSGIPDHVIVQILDEHFNNKGGRNVH